MVEEKGDFVVLRHADGDYSVAIGFPPDTKWEYPVVGHYTKRTEADAAIAADRRVQRGRT